MVVPIPQVDGGQRRSMRNVIVADRMAETCAPVVMRLSFRLADLKTRRRVVVVGDTERGVGWITGKRLRRRKVEKITRQAYAQYMATVLFGQASQR